MKKKTKIIIISIWVLLLFAVLVFVIWAYNGPCDWIGRLNFQAPLVISYSYDIPILQKNESFAPLLLLEILKEQASGSAQ